MCMMPAPSTGPIRVPMPPRMVVIRASIVVATSSSDGVAPRSQIAYSAPARPAVTAEMTKARVRYSAGL